MGQVSPILLFYLTLFTIKYDEAYDNPDIIVFQSLINNRCISEPLVCIIRDVAANTLITLDNMTVS